MASTSPVIALSTAADSAGSSMLISCAVLLYRSVERRPASVLEEEPVAGRFDLLGFDRDSGPGRLAFLGHEGGGVGLLDHDARDAHALPMSAGPDHGARPLVETVDPDRGAIAEQERAELRVGGGALERHRLAELAAPVHGPHHGRSRLAADRE